MMARFIKTQKKTGNPWSALPSSFRFLSDEARGGQKTGIWRISSNLLFSSPWPENKAHLKKQAVYEQRTKPDLALPSACLQALPPRVGGGVSRTIAQPPGGGWNEYGFP